MNFPRDLTVLFECLFDIKARRAYTGLRDTWNKPLKCPRLFFPLNSIFNKSTKKVTQESILSTGKRPYRLLGALSAISNKNITSCHRVVWQILSCLYAFSFNGATDNQLFWSNQLSYIGLFTCVSTFTRCWMHVDFPTSVGDGAIIYERCFSLHFGCC